MLFGIYLKELKTYSTKRPERGFYRSFIPNYLNLEATKLFGKWMGKYPQYITSR